MFRFLVICFAISCSASAFAKCNPDQISIERRTTYGLDFFNSTSNNDITVNIPLKINGRQACYRQSSGIKIQTEKIMENEFIEYEISPLNADFFNVPNPQIYQYLFIDYEDSIKASKVQIASFLCSGESPIGGDAFSDSLIKLAENVKTSEASTSVFIATGTAAENISVSQERKARAKVFDRFLQLYESRSGLSSIETENSNIYIPNVLAGITINSASHLERKLYSSFFSRTNSSINGCSAKFRGIMNDLLIDNVARNNSFPGIEIWKKRFTSKYKMKWNL